MCCIQFAVSCYVVLCYALLCLATCQLYIVACHCLVNYQTEVKAGSWYDGHACYSFLTLPPCLCDRATKNRKDVLVRRSHSLNEYMLCSSAVHSNRMSWHLGRYACSLAALYVLCSSAVLALEQCNLSNRMSWHLERSSKYDGALHNDCGT